MPKFIDSYQLLEAPMEAPFARIDSGKISDTRVQETGPQVAPKAAINPDESYGGPAGGFVGGPVVAELGDDDADGYHAGAHYDGADEEHWFAADAVDD